MKKLKVKTDGTPDNTQVVIEQDGEEIENVERVEIYVNKAGGSQHTIMVVHIKDPTVEAVVPK